MAQSGRNDQFAGFMLGAAKGFLVAAFATAGIQKYGMEPIKSLPWAEEQVKTSWAARWNEEYRPAPRIWSSPPVRHFVNYVERMGLRKPGETSQPPPDEETASDEPTVRTASRSANPEVASDARRLNQPSSLTPDPAPLGPDDQAIADLKAELKKTVKGPN
jgi:hypothetical protein